MHHYSRFVSVFTFLVLMTAPLSVRAQIIYARNVSSNSIPALLAIDLSDCSFCPILTNGSSDQIFLPDQRFLAGSNLYDTNMNYIGSVPIPFSSHSCASLNGLIYITSPSELSVMDPVTLQITYIGNYPSGFPSYGSLYVYNNELYSIASNPPHQIWKVNITNPANSTIWGSLPTNSLSITSIRGTAYANNLVYIADGAPVASTRILRYNPANNELIALCQTTGYNTSPQVPFFNPKPGYVNNLGVLWGLTVSPPGVTLPCICATNAGVMATINPLKVCAPEPAQFPPATGTSIQPDDILQYILCTNPNAPLQTTVATSNTPVFNFNPSTMQIGTNYFIFSVAGNNVHGSASPQDPCFDISANSISVTWGNAPQVAFSVPNTTVCQGDCIDLNVSLTGVPPFSLTYNTGGGNQIKTFATNTGILTVCPPANAPIGSLSVQAIRLEDNICVCD